MSINDIDYLHEIGIQRWHLRRAEQAPVDQVVSETFVEQNPESVPPAVEYPPLTKPEQQQSDDKQTTVAAPLTPVEAETPIDTWSSLVEELERADACMACKSSNPILGEGDLTAEWVWIIDAPSSQDISAQTLISGRAGQLFDAILQAVNLNREQVYLTSVFKCPPSADYTAQAGCGDLLRRQLALIKPKRVVAFGEFAAQALLRSNSTLEQLRATVHQPRSLNCNVIATYSIQDMLQRAELKAQVWRDLCDLY